MTTQHSRLSVIALGIFCALSGAGCGTKEPASTDAASRPSGPFHIEEAIIADVHNAIGSGQTKSGGTE